MNTKAKMLQLAQLLEENAANPDGAQFNLEVIGRVRLGDQPSMSCGTTGCGMGLAALSGRFPRLGYGTGYSGAGNRELYCTVDGVQMGFLSAAIEVFGISVRQARELFDPMYCGSRPRAGVEGELALAKAIREMMS